MNGFSLVFITPHVSDTCPLLHASWLPWPFLTWLIWSAPCPYSLFWQHHLGYTSTYSVRIPIQKKATGENHTLDAWFDFTFMTMYLKWELNVAQGHYLGPFPLFIHPLTFLDSRFSISNLMALPQSHSHLLTLNSTLLRSQSSQKRMLETFPSMFLDLGSMEMLSASSQCCVLSREAH